MEKKYHCKGIELWHDEELVEKVYRLRCSRKLKENTIKNYQLKSHAFFTTLVVFAQSKVRTEKNRDAGLVPDFKPDKSV